ncbi:mitochondrial FAD carrier protein FLX1 [Colletotrichum liriopes]|uniref:Mitochondrial FAD carrier protein FLX1 n=1 Tax=Colletotrichum liriopes TaxID=708192 RepID=A0AA37GJW0_9PEZI|nr:mitochondrial FAD carrier protein FLX1 [Colletotrichum liriopes]
MTYEFFSLELERTLPGEKALSYSSTLQCDEESLVSMSESKNAGISPALVESIAGLSAGSVATLVVHPLDIVKTRMQSE